MLLRLTITTPAHLLHPEEEARHNDAAAENGGPRGLLPQDEVGEAHVEHCGEAPVVAIYESLSSQFVQSYSFTAVPPIPADVVE